MITIIVPSKYEFSFLRIAISFAPSIIYFFDYDIDVQRKLEHDLKM